MAIPLLKAQGLYKYFERPLRQIILNGVDLQVFAGETVAITGRSGCGKSTLLHLLGTLDTPSQGSLSIVETTVTRWNRSAIRNRQIGFTFQAFHLIGEATTIENALMPARIGRQPTSPQSTSYQRAEELLHKMGLGHRLHHPANLLSGGEKQRLAIARALCNDPPLLLADEPTGNLDRKTADEIHKLIFENIGTSKALIVVTHDPSLVALCQTRYLLENGKLRNCERIS